MHEGMRRPDACSEESAPTAQARAGSVPLSLTNGTVRDGPVAKEEADPLPGGRECCAAALKAGHGYWQQRRGADMDVRAVLMQVTGADGSAAIRTGVQGGRVRSLGRCGVITRAVCLDADTALSHGLSPCELVALCRG